MRLICPNCDAQYEVDDNAIPESGRDVQCSNCGHAWFQMSPEAELALLAEDEVFGSDAAAELPEPAPAPAPIPAPVPPAPAEPAPLAPEATPRRSMDESLVAVLREEAEREAAQRRSEAPRPVETQADLGLEEPSGAAAAARRRVEQLKGAEPEPAPAKPATRRDLLPDIEEINSTLRASNEPRPEGTPVPPPPSRAAFRSGFVLMMVIAVAMVLAYVMAPRIAEQIPGSAGTLAAYVASVDQARLWLDQQMQSAIEALNGAGD
ncbi:zinc-ribbon domain-containing protein [Fertoebacter nigrum]|uniref:Zinc-ribbon domain-containing protein n=1 Tax=Fertoeibacter niger TaxID=2656921 RepID=A0A8X8GUU8_9RHOB|nr:zinc-ribbon domain-containing protein [Fertoeibacter niger]NUB44769.1 zinc-ribbon domain-containing protein [Fertoeibacter niger]